MRVVVSVELASLKLVNSELDQLAVTDALGHHRRCEIEFTRDQDTDVRIEDLTDARLRVTAQSETGQAAVLFDGCVTETTQEHFLNSGSRFRVVGASRSVFFDAHRSAAIFRDVDYRDVLRRLGATLGPGLPAGEPQTFHQAGCTDFDFLVRLAFDHGCMTRPNGDGIEVRRGFAPDTHEVTWGDTLLGVRVEARPANAGTKGAAAEHGGQRDHRFHGVRVVPAVTAGGANVVSAVRRASSRAAGGGDPQLVLDQRRAKTLASFRRHLELESERVAGGTVAVAGRSTAISLRAGDQVDLAGSEHFDLPTTGRFGLTRVVHRFANQLYENDFVAIPWANYTSLDAPPASRVRGLVTAIVTNNNDPEQWGRLQVRFPWLNESDATSWVRVLTPYAGNARGMQWLPEIGDEVVVAFEQGDPERPYVVGATWNGLAKASPDPSTKRLVSRRGNSVVMVDGDGKDEVAIYSSAGKVLVGLGNAGTPTLTLHAEGDISIEATGQLRMKAGSLVEIIDGATYRQAGGDYVVSSTGGLTLKSAGAVAIEAGQTLRAAAGMVLEAVGGTLTQIIGALVHIQPPGGPQTRPARVTRPTTPRTRWAEKPVPGETTGSTSADPETPRDGGR